MTDRDIMQQALEALDEVEALLTSMDVTHLLIYGEVDNAITALRERLAQPVQEQEPVLFIHPDTFAITQAHVGAWKPGHELPGYIPLYTTPQPRQWQGLTAPEQTECYDLNPARFANNIEAKLREKNT